MSKELINYAANESNIKWQNIIKREELKKLVMEQ